MTEYDLEAVSDHYIREYYNKARETSPEMPPFESLTRLEKFVAKESVIPALVTILDIIDPIVRETILKEVRGNLTAAVEMGLDPLTALEMI